jgi:hypothetical protein
MRCVANTKKGLRCKKQSLHGTQLCNIHKNNAIVSQSCKNEIVCKGITLKGMQCKKQIKSGSYCELHLYSDPKDCTLNDCKNNFINLIISFKNESYSDLFWILDKYIIEHKSKINSHIEFDFKKEIISHYYNYIYLYKIDLNYESFNLDEENSFKEFVLELSKTSKKIIQTIIDTKNKDFLHCLQAVDCNIYLCLLIILDGLIFNNGFHTYIYSGIYKNFIEFIILKEKLKTKFHDDHMNRLRIKEIRKTKLPNDVCNFIIAKFL